RLGSRCPQTYRRHLRQTPPPRRRPPSPSNPHLPALTRPTPYPLTYHRESGDVTTSVTSQAPNVRPKYVANQSNTSHDNRPVAHTGGKDQSSEEAGMDESHDWALRILGPHGPTLRERIPQLVREAHAASVTSQESSG